MAEFNFNHVFELVFGPLLTTLSNVNEKNKKEFDLIFSSLGGGFSVYFNPYGVLYNPTDSQKFKDAVTAGKFTFDAAEIAKLKEVSDYPSPANLNIFSVGTPPDRQILIDGSEESTLMSDLDKKFIYTLMLASAGRLCQGPETPDAVFVPPPLTFYDRRIIFYYGNTKLGTIPNNDVKVSIGRFEAVLYVKRNQRGTGPQWDMMYGRLPVWTGAEKKFEIINLWSTFDDSISDGGKVELDTILQGNFSNVTLNSLHIVQQVNFSLITYGEAIKLFHFLGNVIESGSYPSQDLQWAQVMAVLEKSMVEVSQIDGTTLTSALLYYFKCLSHVPFPAEGSWMTHAGVRPVEASQQGFAVAIREAAKMSQAVAEPGKNLKTKMELSKLFEMIHADAIGKGGRRVLAEKSGTLSGKYSVFKSPMKPKQAATVTLEEKKTYVMWICGLILAEILLMDDSSVSNKLANSLYTRMTEALAASKNGVNTTRLDRKAASEGGMGLVHTLFWTFCSQGASFSDLKVNPFELEESTEMQWVASLLNGGMQSYVDTNIVRAMAMNAEYTESRSVLRAPEASWLMKETLSDNLFDMLAFDMTADRKIWANVAAAWDSVMDRRTEGGIYSKERNFVDLVSAVRCCIPLMYMIWRITSDSTIPVYGPQAHFFLNQATLTQKSHFGPTASTASIHPAFAYLAPVNISGVPVVKMGKAALIYVGTLLSKESASAGGGFLSSIATFITAKEKKEESEYSSDEDVDGEPKNKTEEAATKAENDPKKEEEKKKETVVVCVERSAGNFADRIQKLNSPGKKAAKPTTAPAETDQSEPKPKKQRKKKPTTQTPSELPPVLTSAVSVSANLSAYTVVSTDQFNDLIALARTSTRRVNSAISQMEAAKEIIDQSLEQEDYSEFAFKTLDASIDTAISDTKDALQEINNVGDGMDNAATESDSIKEGRKPVSVSNQVKMRPPPLFKGDQVRRLTTVVI